MEADEATYGALPPGPSKMTRRLAAATPPATAPLTFAACLHACAAQRELAENFDRLTGRNLSLRGAPIERMIDEASGRTEPDCAAFVAFVYDCVWTRLPREIRVEDAMSLWAGALAARQAARE